MNISIAHPTDRPNFTEVRLGELTLYFSYRTVVGFHTYQDGNVVRENDWGPTTGKHLKYIDNGRKSERISGELFEQRLEAACLRLGTPVPA